MKTSRFVARYIRDASRNRAKRTKIMDLLMNDQPFDEETVGAVVMVDISGFTALTSTLLAQQGRRSSEEMTQAVSKFMSKIIDIISYYGGDVIKFLGDALLIVFESKSASAADLRYTTRRALICCTEVLIKGKTKSVSTGQKGGKKKAFEQGNDVIISFMDRLWVRLVGPWITLGQVKLGIAKSAVEVLELPDSIYSQIKIRKYEAKGGSQTYTRRKASGADYVAAESQDLGEEMRLSDAFSFQFMNQSLVHKVRNLQNSNRLGTGGPSGCDLSSKFTIASATSTGQQLMTTYSNDDDASELSPNKYGPSSEYRRVTIMFMKFRFSYTKMRAHQLFSVLIKGLKPYDGVTQQFSVDDKGQSFFAVFGLPPWSHENNAVFAVRAAITVSDMLKNQGLTPFTIGLSTGDLLFSHMGSSIRSEAGLLGDVVNVAARLMIFNKAEGYNIFCDYDTHEATSQLYQHAEIGLHMLKGKLEPVSIWAIKNSKNGIDNLKINHKDKKSFGYAEEKAKVNAVFTKWLADKNQAVLIVEGPSGMGKTSLLENAMATMSKNDAQIFVIRGSEIERMNPLFPIRKLMRSLYQIYGRLSESEKAAMVHTNSPEAVLPTPEIVIPQITIEIESATPLPPKKIMTKTTDGPSEGAVPLVSKRTQKKSMRKQPVNASMISIDESIEGTRSFIIACGENPDMTAILAPVMDWIGDRETGHN
ncbi:hypothetical protein BDR26DRAFT_984279 [Obelidium mucronatum]|nr:hypothetical protein BDR26DRAFT_984279 [Obelidium mucronatum]